MPGGESQPCHRSHGHHKRKRVDGGQPPERICESESRSDWREALGSFGGDASHPETGRHKRFPGDGRYRAPTQATGLETRTSIPLPVCAGNAVRRPARVVNGIWNRAGNSLSGGMKGTGTSPGETSGQPTGWKLGDSGKGRKDGTGHRPSQPAPTNTRCHIQCSCRGAMRGPASQRFSMRFSTRFFT